MAVLQAVSVTDTWPAGEEEVTNSFKIRELCGEERTYTARGLPRPMASWLITDTPMIVSS